jgi:hypothetical protein
MTGLTRKLGRWVMPDEMLERLVAIHAHNQGRGHHDDQRIGERRIVTAIKERYGIGVSTHTVARWFRENREVLDELATHLG